MKRHLLGMFKSNAQLASYMQKTSSLQNVQSRRAAIKIAVIDDQAFFPQTNLQAYGYTVTPVGDLKAISEIKDYHMVLCDIMGVGRHFDTKAQGSTLIAEIKNAYPEKIVVAYTGGSLNDPAVRSAKERADDFIRKDIDGEEWTAKLDSLGAEAVDPYIIWNKLRARFIELDVDTKDILLLEDAYVRSILSRQANLATLSSSLVGIDVRPDVRAIIQGLASSAIFSAIIPTN